MEMPETTPSSSFTTQGDCDALDRPLSSSDNTSTHVKDESDDHVIEDFLKSYETGGYLAYEEVMKCAKQILHDELCKKNILHEMYDRGKEGCQGGNAKHPVSARRTIVRRSKERGQKYKTPGEIAADMHDLAGIRIALYYPNDFERVESLIKERFIEAKRPQDWPDQKFGPRRYQTLDSGESDMSGRKSRFPGYFARHYRVQLKQLDAKNPAVKGRTLEIQLMSLLMHAWSKMHHELIYKPRPGLPMADEDDERLIDVSSGIIIAGEQVLRQIQINLDRKQDQGRRPFKNEHELWSHIDEKWTRDRENRLSRQQKTWLRVLRNEDANIRHLLYQSLDELEMNNPESVDALVQEAVDLTREEHPQPEKSGITLSHILYITLAGSSKVKQLETDLLKLPSWPSEKPPRKWETARLVRHYVLLICNTLRWVYDVGDTDSGNEFDSDKLEIHLNEFEGNLPSGDDFLTILHPASSHSQDRKTLMTLQKFCEHLLRYDNIYWKVSLALSTLNCFLVLAQPAVAVAGTPKPEDSEYTICPCGFINMLSGAARVRVRGEGLGRLPPQNLVRRLRTAEPVAVQPIDCRSRRHKALRDGFFAPYQEWKGPGNTSWYQTKGDKFSARWLGFTKVAGYLDRPNDM